MRRLRLRAVPLFLLLFLLLAQGRANAYSLLTHEQLIDLTWQSSFVPLLLSRYPNLTPAELERARAYAYGGCVIQDIGYYPFGDAFFSNLTHYVRTGDFVVSLFRNATNANELAFAAGALSHYIGDSEGHALATNRAVPVEFPKLRAQYGPVVNYAEGPHQHVQTEFAFDIDEIAHHRTAPLGYVRHIGLKVPVKQLALAFYQIYGTTENFSSKGRRINVRGYRFAVHAFIPRIAYAVTLLHRHVEPMDPDSAEAVALHAEIAAIAATNDWQRYRHHAGIGTYVLAGLLFLLPKVGPLSLVSVKGPNQATEEEYVHSVTASMSALQRSLTRFTPTSSTDAHEAPSPVALSADALPPSQRHPLPNRDLDTGSIVKPGGYSLTDVTYARLLHRLASKPKTPIPPAIKEDIVAYYANPDAPITTKSDAAAWAQVQADLATLKGMTTSDEPLPYPTYGDDNGTDE